MENTLSIFALPRRSFYTIDLDDRSKGNLVSLKSSMEKVSCITDKVAYLNPSTRMGYGAYEAEPNECNLSIKRKLKLIVNKKD